jgi:hypothetical protein
MKARFGKRDILLMLSAAALCASLLGCETTVVRGGGGSASPGNSNPVTPAAPVVPAGLVNTAENIWIDTWPIRGYRDGFILYSANNRIEFINDAGADEGLIDNYNVVCTGKWEYQSGSTANMLKLTNVKAESGYALTDCYYRYDALIKSDNNYARTLELELSKTAGGFDTWTLDKVSKAEFRASLREGFGKRPAEIRVKPKDYYTNFVL